MTGNDRTSRFWMMASIGVGAFLSHFTAGVINISLPGLADRFHTSLDTVQWITTGYLLIIACLLPVMGWLGDRLEHRRIHNYGYAIFTLSSVLIALSPNMATMLFLRMIQAIGAAMFQATNMGLVTLHIPQEQRGRALGFISTAVAIGGMAGPIAGGIVSAWLSWQWLFLIHVPAAAAATWLAFRHIPSVAKAQRKSMPILPIAVFRIPSVSFGLLISCASFVLANLVLVVMPFYYVDVTGTGMVLAGNLMLAYPLCLAVIGPFAGSWSDRYGSKLLIGFGLSAMATGFGILWLFLDLMSMYGTTLVLTCFGVGMGLIASPNNSFMLKKVPVTYIGATGGWIALTRNGGMALGASIGLGALHATDGPGYTAVMTDAVRSIFAFGFWLSLVCLVIGICGYALELKTTEQHRRESH